MLSYKFFKMKCSSFISNLNYVENVLGGEKYMNNPTYHLELS